MTIIFCAKQGRKKLCKVFELNISSSWENGQYNTVDRAQAFEFQGALF